MEYTLQKVNWGNIGEAVSVEEETLPNSCYLRDNSDYFLNQTKGELTLVLSGDEPVGIGKLSLLPDGSGWLETLRVRPDWQGQGVGKAIYNRWLKEAQQLGCPAVRMFTGTKNVRSRGLAERFGLSLAGTNHNKVILCVCENHSLLPYITPSLFPAAKKSIIHHDKVFHFPAAAF